MPKVLKLSSDVSDVFPKVLKLSSEVSECKPLPLAGAHLRHRAQAVQRRHPHRAVLGVALRE